MNVVQEDLKRFIIGLFIALFIHGLAFVIIQYEMPFKPEELSEYSGALNVVIEESFEPFPVYTEELGIEKADEQVRTEEKFETVAQPETIIKTLPQTVEKQVDRQAKERVKPIKKETTKESIQRETTPQKEPVRQSEFVQKIEPIREEKAQGETKDTTLITRGSEGDKVEETSLFDLKRLDEAIKKDTGTKTPARKPSAEAPYEVKDVTTSYDRPIIVWDKGGSERVLLSSMEVPDIPYWVKREGLHLKVVVSFAVTPEGNTVSADTLVSSGYSDVDAAIRDVVRKLRFNPLPGAEKATGKITYIISPK